MTTPNSEQPDDGTRGPLQPEKSKSKEEQIETIDGRDVSTLGQVPKVSDPWLTIEQPSSTGSSGTTPPMTGTKATDVLGASGRTSGLDETVAPSVQDTEFEKEIETICRRFESEFASVTVPTIEDFLPLHFTGIVRSALIERLLVIELKMLRLKNKSIDTTIYLSRFAEHQQAVRSAIRNYDQMAGQDTLLAQSPVSSGPGVSSGSLGGSASVGSRFHPIKLHAKGGLGAVYLAKDAEIGRMVALKEIQSHHSLDRSSQDRFVTEAIVTGSLEHPGIVPVYGLGRYQDGRPYYAMRFIQGTSFQTAISNFHKKHPVKESQDFFSRDFKSLIRTFIELCSAMYYAHEHGVLHRDIKPDNVMLGKFGETMVVDWGLAKVLRGDQVSTPAEYDNATLRALDGDTMVGVVMGTPAYMSPEQANGKQDELKATTDIYSLGATLFTVLTGERPIDGKSSVEVVLNVRQGNIRRIENISPHAPRAIVSICYKAMKTDPKSRYQTAGEMVEELERWLGDELVLAHKDLERPIERLGRLVRRYHTWAVAGAMFLAAFVVLAAAAVILINRARGREVIAKLQAQESKAEAMQRYRQSRSAIDTWLVGSNDALLFYPGTNSIRQRMLQLAVDDYQRLASSPNRDPDIELERARALLRLGDIQQMRQRFDDARTQYAAAVVTLDGINASDALAVARDAEKANALLRRGTSFFKEQELDAASAEFTQAVAQLQSLARIHLQDPTITRYLAAALFNVGELEFERGKNDLTIESLDAAVKQYAILTALVEDPSLALTDNVKKESLLGSVQSRALQARALTAMGKFNEADAVFTAAIDVLNDPALKDTDDPDIVDALASIHLAHAETLRTQGLQSKLEDSLVAAVETYRDLVKAIPDSPKYAENLAMALTDLGIAKQDHGQSIDAKPILLDASSHWQDLLQLYAEVPRFHEESAACEDALAQVILDATNDPNEAMVHAQSSVQTYQELVELSPETPEYSHRLAVSRSHAAIDLLRLERPDDAAQVFAAAEKGLRELITAYPDTTAYRHSLAHVLNHIGSHLLATGKPDDAKGMFSESIKRWTELAESGHADAANELVLLYLTCPVIELRNLEAAVKFSGIAGQSAPQNARYKAYRAIALALSDKTQQAKTLLDEIQAEQGQWVGRDLFALAIHSQKTNDGQSEDWLAKGKDWQQANQPGSSVLSRISELAEATSLKP